jgi:hypothetical protein
MTPRQPRTHGASPPRSYSFVAAMTQVSLAGPNGPHVYVHDSAQQYYDVRARVLHPRLILAAV